MHAEERTNTTKKRVRQEDRILPKLFNNALENAIRLMNWNKKENK